MPDSASTPNESQGSKIHQGMRIDFFKEGDGRTPLSAEAMRPIIAGLNAFLNLQVVRKPASAGPDGTIVPSATVDITDERAMITLYDGSGAGIGNTLQTVTVSCPSGTTGASSTGTVVANTIFTASQAASDALALELATDRANNGLVCTPNGLGVIDDIVRTVRIRSDRRVIIAGDFTNVGGFSRSHIACLNYDLSVYYPAIQVNENPSMLVLDGSDNAFAGAGGLLFEYYYFANNNKIHIQFMNPLGNEVNLWNPLLLNQAGSPFVTLVASLCQSGSYFIVAGTFDHYGSHGISNIFRVKNDGSYDSGFTLYGGFTGNSREGMLADGSSGAYVWGTGSGGANEFVQIDSTGAHVVAFTNGALTTTGAHEAHPTFPYGAILAGGSLYVIGEIQNTAGAYNSATNVHPSGIMKLNPTTGALDATFPKAPLGGSGPSGFATGSGVGHNLLCLAAQGSQFIVGGLFTAYGAVGSGLGNIVRLNSDGSLDTGFTVFTRNTMTNGAVRHLAVDQSDSTIVIGGNFNEVSNDGSTWLSRVFLCRLQSNGTII